MSLWTAFHVQALLVFAHIVSEDEVDGCVITYSCIAGCLVRCCSFTFSWRRTLPSFWSSSLRALCSALWYWCLLASHSALTTQSLLDFAHNIFFTAELKPSLALFFCLTGNSCSALFAPLLKTELALTLVRLRCFLVFCIHSDPFSFKEIARSNEIIVLTKSPECVWHQNDVASQRTDHSHAWWWCWVRQLQVSNQEKSRWRHA